MRILNYSDTHLNTVQQVDYFLQSLPDCSLYDLITLAGDITNGQLYLIKYLVEKLQVPYVLVFGNHDYYDHDILNVYKWAEDNNINYLKDGKAFVITVDNIDYTVIGGTGWSSFNLYKDKPNGVYKKAALNGIADFRYVKYDNKQVTPTHYSSLHKLEWNWIKQFKGKENVILLTHFPLSKVCLDPFFDNPRFRDLNPYFINNNNTSGFKLAISGHTHTCIDAIDEYGCRHYINALGYQSEFQRVGNTHVTGNNGFDSYKIITF